LATLALSAFVVGTCELVIVGLLDCVAGSTDVSISSAGQLVTGYALGISIGGPIVALTTRVSRRALLLTSRAAFVAGNAVTAAGYGMLMASRVATGAVQGLFVGVASVVAAGLVPPERRAQAMSMVFGGIAVSTVLGVPLGTLLGRALGWRATFVAIIALGVLAMACAVAFVPAVEGQGAGRFGEQARAAFAPPVLAMLGVGLLLIGGQFTAFTYLTPYLQQVTGIFGGAVSAFLLVYGLAFVGGRVVAGPGVHAVVLAGMIVVAVALPATFATRRRRPVEQPDEPPAPALATACHALCLVGAGRAAASVLGEPAGEFR
jgi:DHA1 family inner membrane transport protein